MTTLVADISVKQLRRAIKIKEKIESLQTKLGHILASSNSSPVGDVPKPKRKMSASARRKIAAAQRARWARVRAEKMSKR